MSTAASRPARRRDGRTVAWVVLLVAVLGLPTLAGDEPLARPDRRETVRDGDPGSRGPILRTRPLLQRVGVELETLCALDRLSREGGLTVGETIHRPLADGVERALLREGRDQLADRLVESLELEARLDRLFRRGPEPVLAARSATAATDDVEPGGWEVGLGISRALPRLELRRATPVGDLRLAISADGRAAVRFRGDRLERTELSLDYDGDGRVRFGCAIGF